MEDWEKRAKEEDISSGSGLPEGDTYLYFTDIADYKRINDEYEGEKTIRFLVEFKDPETPSLYLPKSVFGKITEALDERENDPTVVGIRVTRQGKGKTTRYTSVIQRKTKVNGKKNALKGAS